MFISLPRLVAANAALATMGFDEVEPFGIEHFDWLPAALAANGLITPFEVKQLQRNEGTLRLIRARLHAVAGRREDRRVHHQQHRRQCRRRDCRHRTRRQCWRAG